MYSVMTNRKTGTATIRRYDESNKCVAKYHTGVLNKIDFGAIKNYSEEEMEKFLNINLVG